MGCFQNLIWECGAPVGSPSRSMAAAESGWLVSGTDDSQLNTTSPEASDATIKIVAAKIQRRARRFLSGLASHAARSTMAVIVQPFADRRAKPVDRSRRLLCEA